MTIKIGSRRAVSSLMAAEAKKHGIIKPRLLSTLFAPAILSKVFEKYYLLKCLGKKKFLPLEHSSPSLGLELEKKLSCDWMD